ncbi:hypothetical protein BDZ45DRAFT_244818 [Acephala macrosclerotiorum]|nr:hypothetical protein BDZ45DRAFT_244818 [Acephala macrosclerotiorum]
MFRIRKFLGGSKRDGAGANATKGTEPAAIVVDTTRTESTEDLSGITAVDVLSPPQMPDLYSTVGDYGIMVVAEPLDAALDIVFVHGLTGHREKTWKHANGVFWLKLLADDIQNTLPTRIMTWGYDANPARWGMVSDNNVRSHGKNLAYDMSDRRRGCRDRPIIFIAHSLGGLVCEQAVLICKDGDLSLNQVAKSTRSILFMGTPHAGADLAKFAVLFARYLNLFWKTNLKLLDFLKPDSDALEDVQQRFQPFALRPEDKINIYCFYEEREVRGVGYIVPQHSAALAHYPNQSIAANHMEMTKFSGKSDGGYQRVLGRVQDILELMGSTHTSM